MIFEPRLETISVYEHSQIRQICDQTSELTRQLAHLVAVDNIELRVARGIEFGIAWQAVHGKGEDYVSAYSGSN